MYIYIYIYIYTHIFTHLAFVRFENSAYRGSLITTYIYTYIIHIYIYIYIYIHIYIYICNILRIVNDICHIYHI